MRTSPLVSVLGSKVNPLWALQKVEVDNGAATGLAAGTVCIFIHVPYSNDLTITKHSVSRLLPLINDLEEHLVSNHTTSIMEEYTWS